MKAIKVTKVFIMWHLATWHFTATDYTHVISKITQERNIHEACY